MKTVRLGSTSSTLLTTSKKRGFSRNLVSLFVWIFVAVFARTVAGGAVWGGPEEKQELEPAYIPTFFSSGGKRFCLDAAIRHRRAVLYWEPVCWHRSPLTPQGSLLAESGGHWNGGTLNLSILSDFFQLFRIPLCLRLTSSNLGPGLAGVDSLGRKAVSQTLVC